MMSSFFTPRGAPRHPASARALSLSLLLGLSPLAGITPAALAAPEHPAQPAQATPASPAATQEDADEPTYSLPEVDESRHPEMEGFTVSPKTLNITRGGTVTLTTPPLSAEFRQNYEFYEFSLVERGSSYFHLGHNYFRTPGTQYGYIFDRDRNPKQMVENPDGSYTFFLNIGPYIIEAEEGTLFDVILTYYQKGYHPGPWQSDFRLVARAPINVVQDPKPTETKYIFGASAIDDPWKDTTLTLEGFHITARGNREDLGGPALLALYEVDPKTGKIVGEPTFTDWIRYTDCGEFCSGFLNEHFKTSITIPGGMLKPGKVYKIGFYGYDRPKDEKYPGELLNDVADFIPVRSLNKESASPEMFLKATTVSPYDGENILPVRAVGLKKQPGVSYRFSVQHVDEQGRLTGQKALEQEIAAENIHDGTVDEKLNVLGEALNYDGSYRLVLEKVTAGKDDAVESVEQLISKDLQLEVTKDKEVNAAWEWFKHRQVLPEVSSVWEGSNRRDVTVALYRLAGSPKVELPATSPYGDVTPDDPDYAAYIWARQKGITFGWADGNFHPEAEMHNYSTAAFLYRYQRSRGKMSPNLPTAAPQHRNGSLPGSKDSELSTKNWATELEEGSAFWRESRWAVQQRIWGYAKDGRREYFTWEQTPTDDLALMLYRMTHGGSRLK
ncbi:superoxide dismutase [Rothia mucilaginosa]|uniref:superoxide dismutase n=1 Tax=Rothia mucilaginosa TaxID=43675 RepID=UPI0028DB94FC|nr:superoxide dismutase [Rothia mucilaginosa]